MPHQSLQDYGRMREQSPDDCEDMCVSCCCCWCSLFGYMFCCKKMTRNLRIRLLWIWMNILCVISGVLTGVVVFGPADYDFSPTDMRLIKEKSTGIFCESISIERKQVDDTFTYSKFSAHLLGSKAEVNESNRQIFQEKQTFFVESGEHKTYSFYFLAGSNIKISSCADSFVELYVIQGKRNYRKWINDNMLCVECYKDELSIYSDSCNREKRAVYELDVTESDEYYFVYVSRVQETWITSQIHIDRTLYGFPDELNKCTDVITCTFDIKFGKQTWITVHLGSELRDLNDQNSDNSSTMQITCNSRTWVYLLFFLFIPIIVCLFISICIYKFCKDPQSDEILFGFNNFPTERTPLLSDPRRNPATGIIEPPKYEDIVRGDNFDPPPYDEAVKVTVNEH